ncbi:MAG TPA: DoxX family protein [Myxococcaceae bacterium]|jgi:uncharacterized membrane protein YphA (DoxX/SURF4 family)|nr:DoxX family protein [Myxococcaceae bacterium]
MACRLSAVLCVWDAEGAARATQHIQFMKNVAIAGGSLCLYVAGPGRYSVDRRFYSRGLSPGRWRRSRR